MHIATIAEQDAEGSLKEVYQTFQPKPGFVPDHTSVFSLRPDVLVAWRAFQASIRKNLRLRRYELITMAAAQALGCRYCLLAHGTILLDNGFTIGQLRAILTDYRNAGLEPVEVATMEFAAKVAGTANAITAADVEALRAHGLDDTEILDTTLTATMRSFASKTFDALGAGPDAMYDGLARQLGNLLPPPRR